MTVVIATAETGNTFHAQGLVLADMLAARGFAEDVKVVTTTGSVANAELIARGEVQFGFMAANWAPLALGGEEPFAKPIPLAMVSPINSGPLFFVARKDSPVQSFADLRGRKVAIGYQDSGMARHVYTIFGALGWTLEDIQPVFLNQADGGVALARGEVDAQFQPPIPNTHFDALTRAAAVKAVPFSDRELATLLDKVRVYARTTLKAGAFPGHDRDTDLLAVFNVLVTSAHESDARVAAIAEIFAGDPAALAERNRLYNTLPGIIATARSKGASALEPGGVPLHPAARERFRQAGVAG